MNFTTHVGKSLIVTGIQVFAHFDPADSSKNVLDTTSPLTVACPAGTSRVTMIPTTDGTASRSFRVDGLSVSSGASNIVASCSALGVLNVVACGVQVNAATAAPPAIVATALQAGAEFDTPAS